MLIKLFRIKALVLEVVADDARRDSADYPLEGDVRQHGRLEVLDDAGLPNLQAAEVDDRDAAVPGEGLCELSEADLVADVLVLADVEALDAIVVREPLGEVDKANVGEAVAADVEHLKGRVDRQEATQRRDAGIVDLVQTKAELLKSLVCAEAEHELGNAALTDEVLAKIQSLKALVDLQSLCESNQAIGRNLIARQVQVLQPQVRGLQMGANLDADFVGDLGFRNVDGAQRSVPRHVVPEGYVLVLLDLVFLQREAFHLGVVGQGVAEHVCDEVEVGVEIFSDQRAH